MIHVQTNQLWLLAFIIKLLIILAVARREKAFHLIQFNIFLASSIAVGTAQ